MKEFDYKFCLNWCAEEAVAALYWCRQEKVYVNNKDQELNWFEDKSGNWKYLWKIIGYYPYTTYTSINSETNTSEFNFSIGDEETSGLARLLREVWFGYVEQKYRKSDNKTALKIQNRITGKVVYLGWYDGHFTVTELEAKSDSQMFPLEED